MHAPSQIGLAQPLILAVDNGGTKTRVATFESAQLLYSHEYDTPRNYEEAVLALQSIAKLIGNATPTSIGVSIAGKVEQERIVQAGKLSKYGWQDRPFADDVAEVFGVEKERVVLLNDCVAGANAERARRQLSVGQIGAYMVLSTGFGGALYTHDRIIPDEPGHELLEKGAVCGCGNDGCIEAHISGSGIEQKYKQTAETIPDSDRRWEEIKSYFQQAMLVTVGRYKSMIKREFAKESMLTTISFAGSVALNRPLLLAGLQDFLDKSLDKASPRYSPSIERASYYNDNSLYGAAFAAEEILRRT